MIIAICALIFLAGWFLGFGTAWSKARRAWRPGMKPPLPAPDPDSACKCSHEKSYHAGGRGKCEAIDTRMKYSSPIMNGASPPCRCQVYVPSEPAPPAALPPMPPPGRYDPAYVAFLEWWTEHWDESAGQPR